MTEYSFCGYKIYESVASHTAFMKNSPAGSLIPQQTAHLVILYSSFIVHFFCLSVKSHSVNNSHAI
jgi:hypothetical protein